MHMKQKTPDPLSSITFIMKFVIFSCVLAFAVASPQFNRFASPTGSPSGRQIAILRDDRQDNGNGAFSYSFETENGISTNVRGTPGSSGQSNMDGSYSFRLPDGTLAQVTFVADEFGFRAESPLIPTPHPLPAFALEQIRTAEEQRRRGIVFD